MLSPLPIDARVPDILASLASTPNLVITAEPGAGKTTRVPPALMQASFASRGQVLVLEPRRIAARMAARRVASELGERVGERVGYNVRFEREIGPNTQLVFLTEALLTRRLIEDPGLSDVSCVVLDEFHERSLHTDVGLALLRRLQRTRRPELRIVVMSATLDAERLATYLDAPIMHVTGRTFPVDVEYLERPDERRLEEQVRAALRKVLVRDIQGDVLVFLPGAAEIRRAEDACKELIQAFGVEVCMLHGDLPAAVQDRAVRPGEQRKIVLSTNIAETSLTLEGVGAVVDTGLARVAGHSPWTGLSTLSTQKISQASATQRAGRAGRVRKGVCLRLYTKPDFDGRQRFDVPELHKADLCETELLLRRMLGQGEADLHWLDAPPHAARSSAIQLLTRLHALDEAGQLTKLGAFLLDLPVHPRIGRFAHAACERGYRDEAALLAALLSEREIRVQQRAFSGKRGNDAVMNSDLLARLEALEAARGDHSAESLRRNELEAGAVRAVLQTQKTLARSLREVPRSLDDNFEDAIGKALLLAFPDRVGKRRHVNGAEILLSASGSAALSEESAVKEAEFLVAFDADERGRSAIIRAASRIEPEWLLEFFPERVHSDVTVRFETDRERIESSEIMRYDALVLDESRKQGQLGVEAASLLADTALARGNAAPFDVDAVEQWVRRSLFAAQHDERVRAIDHATLRGALIAHAQGKSSFEQLRREPFENVLPDLVDNTLRAQLDRLAPPRIRLPSGRDLKIQYELDRPPWVQSRLQDFFGMLDGPKLAGGKVPLVIHLLAPNQRPVQVSTDLKGFWEKHYAGIRRELMRRYPRHSWPEDPKNAEPPPQKPARPRSR